MRHWREGEDTLLVYFNGPPPDDSILEHPSVQVRAIGSTAKSGFVWQQQRLPAAIPGDGLSVFFSPAYACPLRIAVPRVTAVHDLSFFSYPQDFTMLDGLRRRWLCRMSARVSAIVLACSRFTERELTGSLPDLGGRVRHVPLGPDDDLPPALPREPARERLRLRGPLLLTVGTLLNRRCIPELLRATALLRRRHPTLVLDLVGENRTHPRLDLERLVREYDLAGTVRISGYLDESALADRYAAADVAVFLSEYEGFGLPALEAAARGVPLVTSRAPALGEIFGDAALLVEPRDEAAVAAAVDRVLSDRTLAAQLRAAGAALAARYSWRDTARRTREALAEAAAR